MSATAYTQQNSRAPLQPIEPDGATDRRLLVWAKHLSQQPGSPRVHLVLEDRRYLFQRGHLVATSRRQDG